ncbi:type II toxin-antitoxin system RelE/ParE family toxin [Phyllobacterium leguminum]|uniref:Addiction module RelE/StbE family toxin n=1 Tax=Phyllobacterium leguminum TaxID=314237 RepID=A0A318T472_9HYPH|nr:type II toxin-antitoxin system RelE/ParE family toxin [Phyllobacterium leguminum]PYE87709.1 addiction module RelE/StbE family toxin [Phyllobacterium leguminum]
MSRLKLRWSLPALRHLDQIGAYIAQDNPDAADRVVARIITAVDNLRSLPAMGRIGRIKGTREYVFADIPYVVAYRVKPETIEIAAIFHAAKRWPQQLD